MRAPRIARVYFILSAEAHEPRGLHDTITSVAAALKDHPAIESIPVHWRFPIAALGRGDQEAQRLIALVRGRTASGSDMLLPMGFSGAPHSLLLPEDLQAEIDWAFHNPWGTGVDDLFDGAPHALFPRQADGYRRSASATYSKGWCVRPLVPYPSESGVAGLLLCGPGGSPGNLPLLVLDPERLGGVATVINRRRRRGWEECLLVARYEDFEAGKRLTSLSELLCRIKARRLLRFASLSELMGSTESAGTEEGASPTAGSLTQFSASSADLPNDPTTWAARLEAAYEREQIAASARHRRDGRRRRRPFGPAEEDRRRLLHLVAGIPGNAPRHERGADVVERPLIADMSGTVTLEDSEASAIFQEGILVGLAKEGRQLLTGLPARTYLRELHSEHLFKMTGAFSFEHPTTRGLRARSSLDGEPFSKEGTAVYDSYFIEGCQYLFIEITIQYPVFRTTRMLDRYGPLELPLFIFDPDEPIEVEAKYPDGERVLIRLPSRNGDYVLAGNAFALLHGDAAVLLGFPETKQTPVEQLPVRLSRCGKGLLLSANPCGSYASVSSDQMSDVAQHFNLYLGVGARADYRFTPVPAELFEQISDNWVRLPPKHS